MLAEGLEGGGLSRGLIYGNDGLEGWVKGQVGEEGHIV